MSRWIIECKGAQHIEHPIYFTDEVKIEHRRRLKYYSSKLSSSNALMYMCPSGITKLESHPSVSGVPFLDDRASGSP
jgi:hypothetical protein